MTLSHSPQPPAQLVSDLLAAALEPQRWLGALGQVARMAGASHAQLMRFGPSGVIFNWVSDIDDGMLAAFGELEAGSPLLNYRVAASVGAADGMIADESDYDRVRPTLAASDYVDLCRDWRIPFGCQTNLASDDDIIGFATLRSEADGRTTEQQRAIFAGLRPSVAAAVALQQAVEQQGHLVVAGTFEAMNAACFVLDRKFRVQAISSAAAALVAQGAIRLENKRVGLVDGDAERRLGQAYRDMAERGVNAAATVITTPDLLLRLLPLPRREWTLGFAPVALLIVKQAKTLGDDDMQMLREAFALTPTEAEIARLLFSGIERVDVQARRGISHETLRTHLRSLFGKLGVRREIEAVRLLHTMFP